MGRRKKAPAENHRKTIAQAAHQLFIKNGVEATSVSKIAQAAGYSKATLYVYFKNKEEIFFTLVYEHIKDLYEEIKTITALPAQSQESGLQQYLQICFAVQHFCREYPLYFEGFIGHINVNIEDIATPRIYKDIYQLGLAINQKIHLMIEQGSKLGYLSNDIDLDKATLFIWSALSGIIRMAEQKAEYYQLLGLNTEDFLKEEFLTLLSCYQKK
ncbi:TetR/AcrR family transcriptional regulator [Streptococcus dentasini]